MATEIITSFQQICDANGDPVNGAKINVYDVGTTTPKTVYSDTGLSVSVANPIVTDSAGRHAMRYIATGSYKIYVTTSAGVEIYTRDGIDGRVPVGSGALAITNGGTGATSAGAALSNLGAATAAELAAVSAEVASISGALASTEKTHIATGTTGQRPSSPANGDIRRNTTIPQWEGYNGTGWKYILSEDEVGTSGAKVGLLNANKTDSGTNTHSGSNTFSGTTAVTNSAGVAARNTCKAFVSFSTDGSAVVSVQGTAFNVSGVATATVNGSNGWRVTFSSALSAATYTAVCTALLTNNQTEQITVNSRMADRATTTFDFLVIDEAGTANRNNLTVDIMILLNA